MLMLMLRQKVIANEAFRTCFGETFEGEVLQVEANKLALVHVTSGKVPNRGTHPTNRKNYVMIHLSWLADETGIALVS